MLILQFPAGSLLTMGDKIVGLSIKGNKQSNEIMFVKISHEDENEVETMIQLIDESRNEKRRKKEKNSCSESNFITFFK